jgi:hypothetical protein
MLEMKCQKPGLYEIAFLCCPEDDIDLVLPLFSGNFDSERLNAYQYSLKIQQDDKSYQMSPGDELEECMEIFSEQDFNLIFDPDDRDKWIVGHFADKMTYSLIQSGMLKMQSDNIFSEQPLNGENEQLKNKYDPFSASDDSLLEKINEINGKEIRLPDDPCKESRERLIQTIESNVEMLRNEGASDDFMHELEKLIEQKKKERPGM